MLCEVLKRLTVLIFRGSINDGEIAPVILRDGRLDVLPNPNSPTDYDEDRSMTHSDPDSSIADMEDGSDYMVCTMSKDSSAYNFASSERFSHDDHDYD